MSSGVKSDPWKELFIFWKKFLPKMIVYDYILSSTPPFFTLLFYFHFQHILSPIRSHFSSPLSSNQTSFRFQNESYRERKEEEEEEEEEDIFQTDLRNGLKKKENPFTDSTAQQRHRHIV